MACEPDNTLAQLAKTHGQSAAIIASYHAVEFQDTQGWFFALNDALLGATARPASSPDNWSSSWGSDWMALSSQQRQALADLGHISDADKVAVTKANLRKIRDGYAAWPVDHYVVFWDIKHGKAVNTCNIYVGETLFRNGHSMVIPDGDDRGKYFAARDVYSGAVPGLARVQGVDEVAPGDIAAWSSPEYHVEVVTGVDKPVMGAWTFCSIGGARKDMGKEKCGGAKRPLAAESDLRFYRWCEGQQPANWIAALLRGCLPMILVCVFAAVLGLSRRVVHGKR
jgi:hypothetical protein